MCPNYANSDWTKQPPNPWRQLITMPRMMLRTSLLILMFCCMLIAPSRQSASPQYQSGEEGLQLGAVMMLVKNWQVKRQRKCYFNMSMDSLAEKWKPHNSDYPIILMDTKPWLYNDMVEIKRKWNTLDLKFLDVTLRAFSKALPKSPRLNSKMQWIRCPVYRTSECVTSFSKDSWKFRCWWSTSTSCGWTTTVAFWTI